MDNQSDESEEDYPVSRAQNTRTRSRNTSPISSLPVDVLLEIFHLNTNMDEDSRVYDKGPRDRNMCALNFTLSASHVSSFWRYLIVNTPSLWANIVDLDFFQKARAQWWEIVIWRAQNAQLHVKGSIFLKDLNYLQPWWLDLLESTWPRIRKLDLLVIASDPDNHVSYRRFTEQLTSKYREGLSFLSRPTSVLQSLCVRLEDRCNPVPSGSTLLGNLAPRLRHFEATNLEFATDSTWLSHLRTLHLSSYQRNTFSSVDALYQLLSRMEQLEYLYLDNCLINPDMTPDQAPISLPRLKCFRFYSIGTEYQPYTKSACWPLLNGLILGSGCSIRVIMPDKSLLDDVDCSTISRLAKIYFRANQPRALTLSTSKHLFTLCDLGTENVYHTVVERTGVFHSNLNAPSPLFAVYLKMDANDRNPSMDNRILKLIRGVSLSSSSFHSVLDLYLTIDAAYQRCFAERQFARCLSSFTSLRKLVTDPHTFYHLFKCPFVTIPTVFPRLDVLEVTINELAPLPDMLMPILIQRKEAGVPISTFVYRCASYSMDICILDDFTCLERITDLKVVWVLGYVESEEYTCGSGTPEVLNFKKKWARGEGMVDIDDPQVDDMNGYLTDELDQEDES